MGVCAYFDYQKGVAGVSSTVPTRVLDKSVGRSSVEEMFELIDLSNYLATILTD